MLIVAATMDMVMDRFVVGAPFLGESGKELYQSHIHNSIQYPTNGPTISELPLLILFCSGLGGAGLCVLLAVIYDGCSSTEGRVLFDVPGLDVCASGPASELRLLFTLVPGVGDAGLPLTTPFRVGIWLLELVGVPSEERISREAAGSALGFGVFCFDLKRKLMLSSPVEGGG